MNPTAQQLCRYLGGQFYEGSFDCVIPYRNILNTFVAAGTATFRLLPGRPSIGRSLAVTARREHFYMVGAQRIELWLMG